MFEEYIEKIEKIITPHHYSRENFREKMINSSKKQPKEEYTPTRTKTEDQPIINLSDLNQKEIEKLKNKSEGKLEIPEGDNKKLKQYIVTDSHGDSSKKVIPQDQPTFKKKEYKESDIQGLLERIHNLNVKNMNYRYDIEKQKQSIAALKKEKQETIAKNEELERKIDNLTHYILRLEESISNSKELPLSSKPLSSPSNNINISDLNLTTSKLSQNRDKTVSLSQNRITINNTLLSNSTEIKTYIQKLLNENKKLKGFQAQVFELSKTYDDINDNLLHCINNIQEIVQSEGENRDEQLLQSYQEVVKNVDKILQTKQEEYNKLLEVKDKELELVKEELLEKINEIEVRKKDRLKDQQFISDLEDKIKRLEEKSGVAQVNASKVMLTDPKTETVRKAVGNILKRMQNNFDLKDKDNIDMLGNINKVLQ